MNPTESALGRTVRSLDVPIAESSAVANAIEQIYDDALDVMLVRKAFDRDRLAAAASALDQDAADPGWARPNEKMPVEDIQLLGTDTPATPTYQAPRGASLDAYLESARPAVAAARSVTSPAGIGRSRRCTASESRSNTSLRNIPAV